MRRAFVPCVTFIATLLIAGLAVAETKVTVSGTHLCCGACLKAVDTTLKDMSGLTFKSDQGSKTIVITADSDEAAQKAVDALATAGFYGKLDNDKIKYKPVQADDAPAEKIEITGIHNCCGACDKAIKAALAGIEGIKGVASKAKTDKIVIEGDFDGLAVLKAIQDAGFHGKQPKE